MRNIFLVLFTLAAHVAGAQVFVTGIVRDSLTNEALPGAFVLYGEGKGSATDIDGAYRMAVPAGTYTLRATYVGMDAQEKKITVAGKDLVVDFYLSAGSTMTEVNVISDMAVGRRTPVAFSDISSIKIREELGSRDLPMILNTTPGVYATQSGGGDGDARVNIRGFNQRNVSVMVDGIPMNDMENGWVYWSNWAGLGDAVSTIQVQRGLGASKLAINSVGGTMNIITKTTDAIFFFQAEDGIRDHSR